MSDTLLITCPECGFQILGRVDGKAHSRRVDPVRWLSMCVSAAALETECEYLMAEVQRVEAMEQLQRAVSEPRDTRSEQP